MYYVILSGIAVLICRCCKYAESTSKTTSLLVVTTIVTPDVVQRVMKHRCKNNGSERLDSHTLSITFVKHNEREQQHHTVPAKVHTNVRL